MDSMRMRRTNNVAVEVSFCSDDEPVVNNNHWRSRPAPVQTRFDETESEMRHDLLNPSEHLVGMMDNTSASKVGDDQHTPNTSVIRPKIGHILKQRNHSQVCLTSQP